MTHYDITTEKDALENLEPCALDGDGPYLCYDPEKELQRPYIVLSKTGGRRLTVAPKVAARLVSRKLVERISMQPGREHEYRIAPDKASGAIFRG